MAGVKVVSLLGVSLVFAGCAVLETVSHVPAAPGEKTTYCGLHDSTGASDGETGLCSLGDEAGRLSIA